MAKAKTKHHEPVPEPEPSEDLQPTELLIEIVKDVIELAETESELPPELGEPSAASIEDVLELQTRLDAMRSGAISGLLKRIEDSKAQLKRLGYVDQEPESEWMKRAATVPAGTTKRRYVTKKAATKKSAATEKLCPLCGIPGHDLRRHKAQGKRKRKFTEAELAALAK